MHWGPAAVGHVDPSISKVNTRASSWYRGLFEAQGSPHTPTHSGCTALGPNKQTRQRLVADDHLPCLFLLKRWPPSIHTDFVTSWAAQTRFQTHKQVKCWSYIKLAEIWVCGAWERYCPCASQGPEIWAHLAPWPAGRLAFFYASPFFARLFVERGRGVLRCLINTCSVPFLAALTQNLIHIVNELWFNRCLLSCLLSKSGVRHWVLEVNEVVGGVCEQRTWINPNFL